MNSEQMIVSCDHGHRKQLAGVLDDSGCFSHPRTGQVRMVVVKFESTWNDPKGFGFVFSRQVDGRWEQVIVKDNLTLVQAREEFEKVNKQLA